MITETPSGDILYSNLIEFLFDDSHGLLAAELEGHRFYSGSNGIFARSVRFTCSCNVGFRLIRCDALEFPSAYAGKAAWVLLNAHRPEPCACPCAKHQTNSFPRGISLLSAVALNQLFDARFGRVFAMVTGECSDRPPLEPLTTSAARRFSRNDAVSTTAAIWRMAGLRASDPRCAYWDELFGVSKKLTTKWRGLFVSRNRSGTTQRVVGGAHADGVDPVRTLDKAGVAEGEKLGLELDTMVLRRLRCERSRATLFAGYKTVVDTAQNCPTSCYGNEVEECADTRTPSPVPTTQINPPAYTSTGTGSSLFSQPSPVYTDLFSQPSSGDFMLPSPLGLTTTAPCVPYQPLGFAPAMTFTVSTPPLQPLLQPLPVLSYPSFMPLQQNSFAGVLPTLGAPASLGMPPLQPPSPLGFGCGLGLGSSFSSYPTYSHYSDESILSLNAQPCFAL